LELKRKKKILSWLCPPSVRGRYRQSSIRGPWIAEKSVPSFSLRPNLHPRPTPICRRRGLFSLPDVKQRLLPEDTSTPLRRRLDATGRTSTSIICPAVEVAGRAAAGHATPSTTLET